MTLTEAQQRELAEFPMELRELVHAEIASGNSITEIGHSFPAPPAGAYIKLANTVSTRLRASGDGLSFRERNSSVSSGEFTNSARLYFVVEPPAAPPPEPDMEAIRREHEPPPDTLARLAMRPAGVPPISPTDMPESDHASSTTESATGVVRALHFRDRRPFHEIQFALERTLMVLFAAAMEEGKLAARASAKVNGAGYTFELRYEAALLLTNCYSLRVEGSWAGHATEDDSYFRGTSRSWFDLWTRELKPANAPAEGEGSAERYARNSEEALHADMQFTSVEALQQTIVAAVKRGASFSTSHKEGGTEITWKRGAFVRSDYGDYPRFETFKDEAAFLHMLQQFCHWDVTRNSAQEALSDLDTWKLILRRMEPAR